MYFSNSNKELYNDRICVAAANNCFVPILLFTESFFRRNSENTHNINRKTRQGRTITKILLIKMHTLILGKTVCHVIIGKLTKKVTLQYFIINTQYCMKSSTFQCPGFYHGHLDVKKRGEGEFLKKTV